jgi:hypothetical protein
VSSNWRDAVLQDVTSTMARVRVVADPDGLLLDEDLLRQLDQRGFAVALYADPWVFRERYEEDYRGRWDDGQSTGNLLVRSVTMNLDAIPYDIWCQSEPVYLSVSRLFSHSDPAVLVDLDRRLYDRAFQVDRAAGPGRLSRAETALRLLRTIYAVDPDLVTSREDVWALIAKIHRGGYALSATLVEFLVERLNHWQQDVPVPLRHALASRSVWEPVLRQAAEGGDMMLGARYWLSLLGWDTEIGTQTMQLSPSLKRKLQEVPFKDHIVGGDWIGWADDIATLRLAAHLGQGAADHELLQTLDRRFEDWVYSDYGLLQSLSPYPEPTMLHHVVHYMAHQQDVSKWALIVLDGMSYSDWLYIKVLMDLSSYRVTERAVFAWVPTITSVSRKAIFSGRVPREFGQSLDTTNGEELLWRQFWRHHHASTPAVHFHKTADTVQASLLLDDLAEANPTVVGLVANTVDTLAHSATMGMSQFLTDVKLWITEDGWLPAIITGLLAQDFEILMTSDHGHTMAQGIGKPPSGDVPNSKGQRVQVFPSANLRAALSEEWGRPWPHLSGLPTGYYPWLSPAHKAFASRGQRLISHGGVSMEELIVPVIRITK